jgi:HSP20 family protein
MTALTRWNDAPAMSLRDAFNQFFDDAFTPVASNGISYQYHSNGHYSNPAANIWETGDEYQVMVMLPGVDPDNVELTTLGRTLTIEGAFELNSPEGAKAVWQEFGPAQFRRQVQLPAEVDGDKINAMYRNGILLLTVPKAEHAKPRSIKIQSA